jgi:argininosuccinate synthase
VVAPWREWELKSRQALIAYAQERGIPVSASADKPYSIDRNLLHSSYEGGILEDPWREPDESMFELTTSPLNAPDEPRYLEVAFEQGVPVAVNGEVLSPARLLAALNAVGGRHGIGRVDMVENRYVGIKCRGVYETPGGTIIQTAHRAVESLAMDREVMRLRDSLIPKYSELIYYGYWFSPERELMQKLFDESQVNVTGVTRLKLYKGNCQVVGRKADKSLYRSDYATFEEEDVYDQKDAEGFIKINALRLKIRSLLRGKDR